MPQLSGVLETAVYVEDVNRSINFYQEVMQFRKLVSDERFCALQAAQQQGVLPRLDLRLDGHSRTLLRYRPEAHMPTMDRPRSSRA